ncbi:MAG TPA: hypothetical protein VMV45_13625, partial [Casimicrobiaceae bacterium]|nr:hypothetical protein [Casimicrobiaceae bacterium]
MNYFGINDAVSGDYRSGALFDPVVLSLYDAWDSPHRNGWSAGDSPSVVEARRAVARGQALF